MYVGEWDEEDGVGGGSDDDDGGAGSNDTSPSQPLPRNSNFPMA